MPAKLPDEILRPIPRKLSDTQDGETVYVTFSALCVDRDRNCYLNPDADLTDNDLFGISVTRIGDKWSVSVRPHLDYEPRDMPLDGLIPVDSISVVPERSSK